MPSALHSGGKKSYFIVDHSSGITFFYSDMFKKITSFNLLGKCHDNILKL